MNQAMTKSRSKKKKAAKKAIEKKEKRITANKNYITEREKYIQYCDIETRAIVYIVPEKKSLASYERKKNK